MRGGLKDILFNLIFPQECAGCRLDPTPGELVCEKCLSEIHIHSSLFCGRCRARLPEGKKICHSDFPYVSGAATSYDDKLVKELIRQLKFKLAHRAALPLGRIMEEYVRSISLFRHEDVIVPIPLSRERFRSRGFNQSELLANHLGLRFGVPVQNKSLVRMRHSPPQSELGDFKSRIENVADCFSVSDFRSLRKKRVILVDDVTTSGATFFSAATTLRKAGIRSVVALAAARAGN